MLNQVIEILKELQFVDVKTTANRSVSVVDVNEKRGLSVFVDCQEKVVDVNLSLGLNGICKERLLSGQKFESASQLKSLLENNVYIIHYQLNSL